MKKKSILILFLTLLASIMFVCGGVTVFAQDGTDTATTSTTFYMRGVNARLDDNSGLRFTAEVIDSVVEEVNADPNKCFGALIVPYDYIDDSLLTAQDVNWVEKLSTNKTVKTRDNLTPGVNSYTKEGYKFVSCTISSIKYHNLNRDYFGIIYIKTTETVDDVTTTTYEYADLVADDSAAGFNNVRSISNIARAAYTDYKGGVEYDPENEVPVLKNYILKSDYAKLNSGTTYTEDNATTYAEAYTVEEHDAMVASIETANALVQKGVSTFAGYSIKKALSDYNAIIDGKSVVNPAVQTAIDALKAVETEYDSKYALLYESEDAFNASTIRANDNENAVKTNGVSKEYGYYASVTVDATLEDHVEITLAQSGYNEKKGEYDVVYLPFYVANGGYMRYNLNGSGNMESRHDSSTVNNGTDDNGEYKLGVSEFYIMGNLKDGWNYFTIPVSYLEQTVMYGRRIPTVDGTYMFAMPILAKLNSTEHGLEIFDFNGLNNAVINPNYSYVRNAEGKITTTYSYHNQYFVGSNDYQSKVAFVDDNDYGMVFSAIKTGKYKNATDEANAKETDIHHMYQFNFEMIEALCRDRGVSEFSFYVKYNNGNDFAYCFGTGAKCHNWTKYTVNIDTKTVTCVDTVTGETLETKSRAGGFDNYVYRLSASMAQTFYISNFYIEV